MAVLSDRMKRRFEELGKRFAEQLPARIAELEATYSCFGEASDLTPLVRLRDLAHRLAGTGATFGYAGLSRDARLLESEIDAILENGQAPPEEQHGTIGALIAAIAATAAGAESPAGGRKGSSHSSAHKRAAERREHEVDGAVRDAGSDSEVLEMDKIEENGQPPLDTPVLYDNTESGDEMKQIFEQLSFFGFEIRPLAALDSASYSAAQPAVVLTEVSRLVQDRDDGLAPHIAAIEAGVVKLVCFSSSDSVGTRLSAVRAGSAAFVSRPVDLVQLIDGLEALTNKRPDNPFHILLVDDDPEQVSHVAWILQQAGMITSVVTNPHYLFSAMIDARPELILLDMYLGDCTGVELTKVIRQQEVFVGVPIVYLSIESDREKQIEAIAAGADDFLTKPVDPEQFVRLVRTRCQRTRAMRYYMERDSLTGLRDHSSLMDRLSTELQRASRLKSSVCFAMLDLDYFKRANDRYGHLVGDRVLKTLARLLQERLRNTDAIGRWGGEEFGVILLDTDVTQGARLMNAIREQFSELVHQVGHDTFQLTFSCGVAAFPQYDGAMVLTEAADRALYAAKEQGRNKVITA